MGRKLFGLKEGFAPALADEIVPSFETLFPGASENFRLREEHLVSQAVNAAGTVANVGFADIQPGANNIFTMEGFYIGSTQVQDIFLSWVFVPFSGSPLSAFNDNRDQSRIDGVQSVGAFKIVTGNVAAFVPSPLAFRVAITAAIPDTGWIPYRAVLVGQGLQPATSSVWSLQFTSNTVNTNFILSVAGYERNLEPQEKF